MSHDDKIDRWCRAARQGRQILAAAGTADKDAALLRCAELLRQKKSSLMHANGRDLEQAEKSGLSAAMLDRLRLDAGRIEGMARACEQVAALADPVGQIDRIDGRPSGIRVGRMRMPLGTILIIYESRPNVTVEAAALCLKAGNAVILRGGKEAAASNAALVEVLREALVPLSVEAVQFVDEPDRDLLYTLLTRSEDIDLVVPRGGESLIRAVVERSRIPVVQHFQGICHVYVDASADAAMAEAIVINAKTQRPGVCNAVEGIILHAQAAKTVLPGLAAKLLDAGVELRGCARSCALVPDMQRARPQDFDTEFLDLVLAVKLVDSLDEALDFIRAHGSQHSEAIVTADHAAAERFVREVDASCVLVNASTRFNDGGELGLGAEIGISTTKIHAYGPMGLQGLTCQKFVVYGSGQVRL